MGRPLNKKYFGNRNIGSTSTTADNGIGGEGVASVPNATGLSGMTPGGPYAILAADISAPDLPGGIKPTLTFTATGATTGTIQVVDGGSGYTSAPTVVVRGALAGGSGTTTKTAVLNVDTGNIRSATNQENALIITGYLTGGSALATDVIKQVSTNRYKVTDGTRTGIVKLVAKASGSLAAGEANLIATDASSNTYYVTKLTAHKALLTRTSSGSGEFASNTSVAWTMNGTSGTKAYDNLPYLATGVNVQIANG